uniref:protein-tyrosine-phosphatase n=1 Tax=Pelusios castaneus TaxID=367368 RepID=A0A8C8R7Y3_9SAUR
MGWSDWENQVERGLTAGEGLDGDPGGPALTPDLESAELSPILPFLFLGNERDAQDLEQMLSLNVGHVLNVTTHLPLYHAHSGHLRYKRLPATDNSRQDLRQYFEEAFEFIGMGGHRRDVGVCVFWGSPQGLAHPWPLHSGCYFAAICCGDEGPNRGSGGHRPAPAQTSPLF